METLIGIIEENSPIPKNREHLLKQNIQLLWRELTSERVNRKSDYIGELARLSAYFRYFLPWNILRIIPILAGIELDLDDGSRILDIGSGPLTLPIALWIARPELRKKKLSFTCIDRVGTVMEKGLAILDSLQMRTGLSGFWNFQLKKGVFPGRNPGSGIASTKYNLVTEANVFNEIFWKDRARMDEKAARLGSDLKNHLVNGGRIFLLEPGDPRSASMLAALRDWFISTGSKMLAPCPHQGPCPMSGYYQSRLFSEDPGAPASTKPGQRHGNRRKLPWCHFSLPMDACPKKLEDFSRYMGLPKERLVSSWLYIKDALIDETQKTEVRLVSDSFVLPGGQNGRYACSRWGYTLVKGEGSKLPSMSLLALDDSNRSKPAEKDHKSGAILLDTREFS